MLRRGALPHWLRGIGGARDRAGPLLRARDQARETGLPFVNRKPDVAFEILKTGCRTFSRRFKACSYIIQGASAAISIFLPVFRVRQFTNKPEIMLMLRARIAVLKAKERRP